MCTNALSASAGHTASNVNLDRVQLEVLPLGPKFCFPRKKADQLEIESQFEQFFDQTRQLWPTSIENLEAFKTDLVNMSYHYHRAPIYHRNPLTPQHMQALKDFLSRDDILITRPDKCSEIVILNKTDYIEKMSAILSDESKFLMTNENDYTKKVESQLTECLKRLKDNGCISKTEFDNLKPTGTHIPRLYGLPKIHKENCPLRPILDMSNSPYHAIARWLKELIKPIQQHLCKHSLHDTFDFVDSVKDLEINNKRMCSLDIVSLFTNVPLLETIDFICDFICESQMTFPIPLTDFKELLLRCTFNVQFLFNGTIYRQRDGVAMGSPLGPILADIFVSKLESDVLKPVIDRVTFYKRYVDDIFIIHDANICMEDLVSHFNTAHSSIKFNGDMEANNQLHFLDVQLTRRSDGTIKRGIYRKPTWSGQYTNFLSFVAMRYKRNLVKCLANRVQKICSVDCIEHELRQIRQILLENGYPEAFLDRHLKCHPTAQDTIQTVEKLPLYLSLPFRGDLAADTLTKRLYTSLRRTFNAAVLRLHFHSNRLLQTNLKDRIPVLDSSMIIYSFVCQCSANYVGRTTRRLSERIREHKPNLTKIGLAKHVTSAIAAHLIDTNHSVNFNESFNILYRIPPNRSKVIRQRALETTEAIAIRLFDPNLCRQKRHVRALSLPWPSNQVPVTN